MKKISLIILVLSALIFSCKKEKKPADVTPAPNAPTSQAFSILTGTKWKQTHYYIDTGAYAGAHLSTWPLSTTQDAFQPTDTCYLTSKVWWRPSYDWLTIKGQACSASMLDTANNGTWALSANDDYLIINNGVDSIHILELNNNYFKQWFKSVVTNSVGAVIQTDYQVWVYEPAP